MEPTEIKRTYQGSDAFMTESARVNYNLANIELAKFTVFDSTINATFMTAYLTAIVAAETVVADSAISDQQVQTTENVLSQMDLARAKYNEVKYFAQKAFPNSAATQGEFGLNDYMDAPPLGKQDDPVPGRDAQSLRKIPDTTGSSGLQRSGNRRHPDHPHRSS